MKLKKLLDERNEASIIPNERSRRITKKSSESMRNLFIKTLIITLFCFFEVQLFAQEFKIEGSLVGLNNDNSNLTLIRLSDDSIAWTGKTEKNGAFSIMVKSDDYALCAYNGSTYDSIYHEAIVPVNLTSDTNIGEVLLVKSSKDSLHTFVYYISGTYDTGKGISWEKQREIQRMVLLSPMKRYDMMTILDFFYFAENNYRIDEMANHAPKIFVDDKPVDLYFPERMNLLKNMSAKEVKYFEKIPPSKAFTGGSVRIVTKAYAESGIIPEGFYKIQGKLEEPSSLALIQNNTVVWTSSTFLKDDSLDFNVNFEKGQYVLVVNCTYVNGSRYIPVNLSSNVDLGVIKCNSTPLEVVKKMSDPNNWEKTDFSLQNEGRVKHTPGPLFKQYDVLRLLNRLGFWDLKNNDFRGVIKSDRIATVKIDDLTIEQDYADLVLYLQNLPANNIEYIETFLPSEGSPGGTINIVTSSNQ